MPRVLPGSRVIRPERDSKLLEWDLGTTSECNSTGSALYGQVDLARFSKALIFGTA